MSNDDQFLETVAYGTGNNFYYGKGLKADSQFSSYISNKKFPTDYFLDDQDDEGEEEMENKIFDSRVYKNNEFKLVETLRRNAITEGFIADFISAGADMAKSALGELIGDGFRMLGDKLGLEVPIVPALAVVKNLKEINDSTNAVDKIVKESKEKNRRLDASDISDLEEIKDDLLTDLKDLVQSCIEILPGGGFDSAASFIFGLGGEFFIESGAEAFDKLMSMIPKELHFIFNADISLVPAPGADILQDKAGSIVKEGLNTIVRINDLIASAEAGDDGSSPQAQPEVSPESDDPPQANDVKSAIQAAISGAMSSTVAEAMRSRSLNFLIENYMTEEDEEAKKEEVLEDDFELYVSKGKSEASTTASVQIGTLPLGQKPKKQNQVKESVVSRQNYSNKVFGRIKFK